MFELIKYSKNIRKSILLMANKSKSAHVGSSLSIVDILTVLYFDVMKISDDKYRDRFILSKGHAAMALYATLAERGIISKKILNGYFQNNGTLPAHLDRFSCKGVEVSTGSLGHGLSMGLGIAYSLKLKKNNSKVFVLIGDGESQEGSIWEAAMLAPKLNLDNLVLFIDYNKLQGYGKTDDIVSYESITSKWKSFNWNTFLIDGHNFTEIKNAINEDSNIPKVIICKTIKGKGISFMENELKWHYYVVQDEHLESGLKELK